MNFWILADFFTERAPGLPFNICTPERVRGQVKTQRKVTYRLGRLNGHRDAVRSVAFSPDGTTIASGSDDRSVRVWDAATGGPRIDKVLKTLMGI